MPKANDGPLNMSDFRILQLLAIYSNRVFHKTFYFLVAL